MRDLYTNVKRGREKKIQNYKLFTPFLFLKITPLWLIIYICLKDIFFKYGQEKKKFGHTMEWKKQITTIPLGVGILPSKFGAWLAWQGQDVF